jgi:hypothetical protein
MCGLRPIGAVILLCVSLSAGAQSFLCAAPASPGFVNEGFLDVSPAAPRFGQSVFISAGRIAYVPHSVTSQIEGHVISVVLTGSFIGFLPPPTQCLKVSFDHLNAGAYTVNAYIQDDAFITDPPSLFATSTFVVSEGAAAIPALSSMSFIVLLLLMSVAARDVLSPNLAVNRTRRFMLSTWRASRRRSGYLQR